MQVRITQSAHHNALARLVGGVFTSLPPVFYLVMPGLVYVAWLYQIELPATAILLSLTLPVVVMRTFIWLAKPSVDSSQTVLLWSTIFLMSAVTLIGMFSVEKYWRPEYANRMIVLMLVYPAIALLIAKDAKKLYESSLWIYGCAWLFLIACVALGTYQSYSQFGLLYIYFRNWELDSTFNYQVMGDMVAVVSLLVLARVPRYWKVPFFFLSMAAVALCFSRSAALCFAAAALVILFAGNKGRDLLFTMAVAVLGFMITFSGIPNATSLGQSPFAALTNRINQVTQGVDQSLLGRQEIASEFAQIFERDWLFGELFYELNGSFGEGGYLHNIISYLLTYGAPTFILLLAAIFLAGHSALRRISHSPIYLGIGAVLLFSVLSAALFRSHVWHILWFALALVASLNTSYTRKGIGSSARRGTQKMIR